MVIAFDFDGTVADGGWPDIWKARPNRVVIDWLKRRKAKGDQLIMWTCRENYGGVRYPDGPYLNEAIRFCNRHQLFADNVNMSIDEVNGDYGTKFGRKVTADFYLDDNSVPFNPKSPIAGLWWRLYLLAVDLRLALAVRRE